jgi:rubredoxin
MKAAPAFTYKCPHCGWVFYPYRDGDRTGLVPLHNYPDDSNIICPGAEQKPRDSLSDRRTLWKDLPPGDGEVCYGGN